MNSILSRQNEEQFLQYLAAQRQLYNEEKSLISTWMIVTTLVAVLGSGYFAYFNSITAFLTLGTILVLIGELAALYIIDKRGQYAASIQELFDTELFELPWNDYLVKKPKKGLIIEASERFKRVTPSEEIGKLRNWYISKIANLPIEKARIICQLENIHWDVDQRHEYIRWISSILIFVVLVFTGIGIAANWTFQAFFAGPALLMASFVLFIAKHILDHLKAIDRLKELSEHATHIMKEAEQEHIHPEVLTQQSRELQNEIYRHRANNPPVFNWFYELIRDKYQKRIAGGM